MSCIDKILLFSLNNTEFSGKFVRLEETITNIIKDNSYPNSVANLLIELTVITSLLGTNLKFNGLLNLKIESHTLLDFITSDYFNNGTVRSYAKIKDLAIIKEDATFQELTGNGRIIITMTPGNYMNEYQSIIALDKENDIASAIEKYFLQSEQLPSYIKIAVSDKYVKGNHSKCAGGMIIQNLFSQTNSNSEQWLEIRSLLDNISLDQLVDANEDMTKVLQTAFYDHDLKIFEEKKIEAGCRCSREKFLLIIQGFSLEEKEKMKINDKISVTCHFCNKEEIFDKDEI